MPSSRRHCPRALPAGRCRHRIAVAALADVRAGAHRVLEYKRRSSGSLPLGLRARSSHASSPLRATACRRPQRTRSRGGRRGALPIASRGDRRAGATATRRTLLAKGHFRSSAWHLRAGVKAAIRRACPERAPAKIAGWGRSSIACRHRAATQSSCRSAAIACPASSPCARSAVAAWLLHRDHPRPFTSSRSRQLLRAAPSGGCSERSAST